MVPLVFLVSDDAKLATWQRMVCVAIERSRGGRSAAGSTSSRPVADLAHIAPVLKGALYQGTHEVSHCDGVFDESSLSSIYTHGVVHPGRVRA